MKKYKFLRTLHSVYQFLLLRSRGTLSHPYPLDNWRYEGLFQKLFGMDGYPWIKKQREEKKILRDTPQKQRFFNWIN